ncbi:MAG: DUF3667 domain-containing protein [Verrucomicrobiota bacterium]|nr:DUF3667 domain-containing protein [Verrucomicrobiota bacterium]
MADETTPLILDDASADALKLSPRQRRFFERKKERTCPLTHCENCGAAIAGEFCAQCGQHAIDYRRSFARVALDAADSFLNWDTKFLKSIGILIATPWKLTNDFNAGKRARYVHPLRLYLLASIAFFLVAKAIVLTPGKPDLTQQDRAELDATIGELADPASPLTPEQRAKIEAARARLDAFAKKKNAVIQFDPGDEPTSPTGKWLERRIKDKVGEDGTKGQLFLDTLRGNIPTMMLFCIPIFALILKVLYIRQRRFYIEHLVYALHIHSFVYVAVTVVTLLALAADRWLPSLRGVLIALLSLLTFIEVFISVRRVYAQRWLFTTVKFLLGGIAYLVILVVAVGATAFVTLLLP